jgi:8-amino-7-oxononanoate synthase
MPPIEERLLRQLNVRSRQGTLRSLISSQTDENFSTSNLVDFSSNDYLGLARSRQQLKKVQGSYESYLEDSYKKENDFDTDTSKRTSQTPFLGATGSRLLSGNSSYPRELERKLAKIHNRPSALLCNSGYDANLSVLSSIPLEEDIILMDELAHNSLVMGVRMGRVKQEHVRYFRHNDVGHLKQLLMQSREQINELSVSRSREGNIFVVCESVYSMDGDIAPLTEILDCALATCASVSNHHSMAYIFLRERGGIINS